MKKLLYSASVVLLGAGLGIAQTTTNAQNTAPTETIDTRTPSALDPQTASPDSINLMNPVTGQNPDSHRSPNALPLSSSYDNAKH